jgi:alpha-tubulin suppressor-like RCC1 family protein
VLSFSFDFISRSHRHEPTLVEMKNIGNCRWYEIACGSNHTIALTKDGKVYTWGRGDCGALGHGDQKTSETPTQVMSLAGTKIVHISSGKNYSAAITGDGDLYTWWVKQAI